MSPIERIKAHLEKRIEDAADCGYSAAERREELSALDALIAENAAAKARAEKAEALWQDHHALHAHCKRTMTDGDIANLFGERMTALVNERDALRKALELARPYVSAASVQMYDGGQGAGIRQTARDRLETIDAALHGTAKQEPFPSISRHSDTGECLDSNVVPQEPEPRTCYDCRKYVDCSSENLLMAFSDRCFSPRADAQKGQP